MKFVLLSSAALALSAAVASAGGFVTAPDPVVVEPLEAPLTPGDWQGAYGGVSLGYAFNGDDDFGFDYGAGETPSLGNLEIGGVNGGLHVGYRWQRDRWVFGPELSVMGGQIDDSFDFPAGTAIVIDGDPVDVSGLEVESQLNHVVALKLKTGYAVQPNMLVYGTAGIAKGDYTYSIDGEDFDYDADGYVFGLGVERMVSDRMSLFGEIEHNEFDKEEIEIAPGVVTNASPSFSNVKVGLNFKF